MMALLGLWGMGCPHPLAKPEKEETPKEETPTPGQDGGAMVAPHETTDAGTGSMRFDAGGAEQPSALTDAGISDSETDVDAGHFMTPTDAGPTLRPDAGLQPSFNWEDYDKSVDPNWLTSPPACTAEDWLAKYLKYRQRLRGSEDPVEAGFVSIGLAQGESLPASYRDPDMSCVSGYHIVHAGECVPNDMQSVQGVYKWGDGTVQLGYYIATLASEYKAFEI